MSDVSPSIAVVGEGPAVAAVDAALSDVSATVETTDVAGIADADLGIVVGVTGSDGFVQVNQTAADADVPWIAIEVGGIGGHPTGTGTVSVFSATGPCYACLRTRVAANTASTEELEGESMARTDARFAGAVAGRLAVAHVTGDPVTGTVIEIPRTERELLAVPTCPVCGSSTRDHGVTRSHATMSVTESADRAERAVDDRLGIVSVVGERESYPAPYYLANIASTDEFSDGAAMDHAAGVAPDWDAAYMKALGEAMERYAAAIYREDTFETATVDSVESGVPPSAFVRPDDATDPSADDAIEWLPGTTLSTDESVKLPAEFVVFPPPEERFAPAITTGLGLGNSPTEALLSGLYEVIERDAMMLSWYSTYDPVGIAGTGAEIEALTRRCRSEGLTTQLVLLTQDIDVPVVAATVTRDEWPRFAAGTSAALDPNAAGRAALAEAVQNWMELRSLGQADAAEAGRGVARYADRPGEVTDFFDPDTTVDAAAVGPDTVPSGEDELDAVCDRVADVDLTPYATRLTTRDVDTLGFEVTRVLIPDAQPLFIDDPFFGDRARTIPNELGYRPRLDRGYHPFP